jgi:hypothetical protein
MTTFDESTNHDLPGEIHDAQSTPAGDEDWRDPNVWNDENDAPDFDEESMGADGDFYDCEDNSWSDSDSLTSCGWGEDESYGCFE